MKIWVVKANNGKYLASDGRLVNFGCSRVFKGEKSAKEKIFKLEQKKTYPEGFLSVQRIEVSEKKRFTIDEVVNRLNAKDEEFVQDSYNYKMIASCRHGFLNAKYRGYHTLEDRFVPTISRASLYKTFVEMYAQMQIQKSFVEIPGEHIIKMWIAAGDYKDEVEGATKLNELLNLLSGENMDVCFIA